MTQLSNVDASNTDYLLGLFARADMSYDDKRDSNIDPSLSQMVAKAIEVCSYEEQWGDKTDARQLHLISGSEKG